MAGEPVVNNKVLIPRGNVVCDFKEQRWIVGDSLSVGGTRDIYAVARCDNNESESYPAVMIFPNSSDPQTAEMQARIGNPKTIEKWKKSRGIRHLGVTPILGAGNYKYNNEMRSFIITQRYTKNLQQLLTSNDKGFILPTVYRVIGQMFYALEYIHNLGYHDKFDISSDKLLQSFTNPNDIYLDVIDYGELPKCLTYRSGKFQEGSPYADLESVLYNAFNWLKLPLPWQNETTDETLVNKQKMRAFAHVDRFLRRVFGRFGVLSPIKHIMLELASSDARKEPDYKKFLSIISEGVRNLKNVQHNLDSSLNFDEQLKLRQINKFSRQLIPSSSDDSSDEKDSKDFKKTIDARGNAEDSLKKAVPEEKVAKTAQNVTIPSAKTTATTGLERSTMTEPPKNIVNEEGKPKEQQRAIPKSASEVGASTSSNVQPGKNVATTDSIGSCKCKVGVVNGRVNDDALRGPKIANTVQSPGGSGAHSKREVESRKGENKTGNSNVKVEVINVSSGDEASTIGKSNSKVEKPRQKSPKESLGTHDARSDCGNSDSKSRNSVKAESSKEKRKKSRSKGSISEDSDSDSSRMKVREESLKKKKKKRVLEKKKKEKGYSSDSSDSDDDSSDSSDNGKSKSNKKKRKKHRSASSDSGETNSKSKKRVKSKNSKKKMKDSDSDLSPIRDSNKKESRSKRSSKRRQDRESDASSSRHSSRKGSRSRTYSKKRKDGDRDSSPRRSSERRNESSSRNRQKSPNNYSERRSSRYQSDSSPFRYKMSQNSRYSNYHQSSPSFYQASKDTQFRYNNRLHYNPPRFRPPYMRSRFSQSRDGRMPSNNHETQPGRRWNSFPPSDGRSTSPASSASSHLIEQTRNENYGQEEALLRNVNAEENGSGQVPAVRDYRRRGFEHNLTDDQERYKERDRTKELNRVEGRDRLMKKSFLPPARHTDEDFERELRTVEQQDPMSAYVREDEANEEQK